MFRARSPNHAFTLMELMMAILVLFYAVLFIVELFITTSRYTLRSKERATAAFLAQSKMESTLVMMAPGLTSSHGTFEGAYSNYQYNVDIKKDELNLKVIRVTVTTPGQIHVSMSALR